MNISRSLAQALRISPMRTARLQLQTGEVDALCGWGFRLINQGTFSADAGVRLGTSYYGFIDYRDGGIIRNRGNIHLGREVVIASGNRWDIGEKAQLEVGAGTYFSPFGRLISTSQVTIGANCAIGWDVQFLDDDFHIYGSEISSDRQVCTSAPISIGDNVWMGSGVRVFKGVQIANNCIIAGGSVVTRSCAERGVLLGGNPARILRQGVTWA